MKNKDKKPVIGIVGGKGKLGRWFNDFFINEGFEVLISDTKTSVSNKHLAERSDIVIVSVPIIKTVEVIKEIKDFVRADALLCDVASLKSKPVEALKKAKCGTLGMHPLFGPLTLSLSGQNIVFCPVVNNKWSEFLETLFKHHGANIIKISPEEHDRQMAMIQALTHFSNISLARTVYSEKWELNSAFFTPVFRLQSLIMGRILDQRAELLAEIEMENPYFPEILSRFEKELSDLNNSVRDKDVRSFVNNFNRTSKHLDNFKKIAETRSAEILRLLETQPLKVKKKKKAEIDLKNIKVGFLGPRGTFSDEAAGKIFSSESEPVPVSTIKDVFEKVNSHEIDLGVVPIENSSTGIVSETIHNLINYPLKVTGSFDLRVHQCLLSRGKSQKEIDVIITHEQALSQCQVWLEKNLPNIKKQGASSTITPIMERGEKKVGFIAPQKASEIYDLNILAENIEDNKDNYTKFYVISNDIHKDLRKKLNAEKTVMLFAVYDRVGILRDILDVFTKNKINLTSLHSIPAQLRVWDYVFFVEVESSYFSPKTKKVIKELEEYCSVIRVIGVS
ncbi:MAG: prephenate dehydrogenase/arogenate dehydrogenase family protein [Candidatus Paceibacterota bacterium]